MLRIIHEITFAFAFFCVVVALFLDLHSWTLTVHLVEFTAAGEIW